MRITLAKLLEGKSTVIKNKEYLSTSDYVKPFIDKLSKLTSDFRIDVQTPKQMTKTNNADDITYNKVLIQAVLNRGSSDYKEVVCMAYGIDIRQPAYKIYKAFIDKDENLYAFDDVIIIDKITPSVKFQYDLDLLLGKPSTMNKCIDELSKIKLDFSKTSEILGDWLKQCILNEYSSEVGGRVKLSTSDIVKVFNSLYVSNNSIVKGEYTLLDAYVEFSKLIQDDEKDIINKFDKTYLIKSIIKKQWQKTH